MLTLMLLLAASTTTVTTTSTTTTTALTQAYRAHDAILKWAHEHPNQRPSDKEQRENLRKAMGGMP